jgi:hypothetical protein
MPRQPAPVRARDVMTREVLTVTPGTTIRARDLPAVVIGGGWGAVLLLLFGVPLAALAVGAAAGLIWLLWRFVPQVGGVPEQEDAAAGTAPGRRRRSAAECGSQRPDRVPWSAGSGGSSTAEPSARSRCRPAAGSRRPGPPASCGCRRSRPWLPARSTRRRRRPAPGHARLPRSPRRVPPRRRR